MQRHPQVQWILWQQTAGGFTARCEACGVTVSTSSPQGVDAFATDHQAHASPSAGHYGAGDLVARATKALGIEPCTPCEARRRQLNGLFPRVFPRR